MLRGQNKFKSNAVPKLESDKMAAIVLSSGLIFLILTLMRSNGKVESWKKDAVFQLVFNHFNGSKIYNIDKLLHR